MLFLLFLLLDTNWKLCSGECAAHFGIILKKFPPQVSSRSAAAAWGCHVHNEVNKSLKKPLFDCGDIGDFYDCGCAEDENDKKDKEKSGAGKVGVKKEIKKAVSDTSFEVDEVG
jgi:hypothetical protein